MTGKARMPRTPRVIGNEIIRAFDEDSVTRLTRLTQSQLRYWDKTGFFAPEFAEPAHGPFNRLYSFRDVVSLRTLSVLRNQYNVPLQHLRKVADKLSHFGYDLWTRTTLYVLNKKVIFHEPDTDIPQEVVSGQYVIGLTLKTIFSDTKRDVEKMRQRNPEKIGHVERSRHVNHNAWVIGGTRIPTAAIRRFKEAGYSDEEIIAEYPDLTPADIKAALLHEEQKSSAA
jgi:uncharacterized protein (DUF433 family)